MVPVIETLETHRGIATRIWGAAATRPTGYPKDLPFLASREVTLLAIGDSNTVEWGKVPESTTEGISRELVLEGWSESIHRDLSSSSMQVRIYRRGDRQRVMIHNGGQLTLLDTRVA